MSAPNKITDIEKKSHNAANVEMFCTTTEYILLMEKNHNHINCKKCQKISNPVKMFKMVNTKFRKNN